MRPVVLEAWREAIAHRASELLPGFSPYHRRERGEDRGLLRLASEFGPSLTGFVVFRPIEEAFDAYVGWSTDGRCPYARTSTGASADRHRGEMLPSMVLAGRSGTAHWNFWNPPTHLADDPAAFAQAYCEYVLRKLSAREAMELVRPVVEVGVREVAAYGLPYLAARAALAT